MDWWKFFIKWHLPGFLLTGLLLGYFFPSPGSNVKDTDLRGFCIGDACVYASISNVLVGLVFVFSGLKLKTDEIKEAVKSWKPALFGVFSILVMTPATSLILVNLPFKIDEFALGLAIFFCQATTLSSGLIISDQARGNVTLALGLTVVSNIMAVITMPLFVVQCLTIFTGSGSDISISVTPIIVQLLFLILAPLILGKLLRNFKFWINFAVTFSLHMKLLTSLFLAIIVWMQVSESAEDLKTIDLASLVLVVLTGILVHLLFLGVNFIFCKKVFKFAEEDLRTVVILASQKTLPVSITILELLDLGDTGSVGIATIPVISSHFVQIVIDAFLAGYWSGIDPNPDEELNEPGAKSHAEVETKSVQVS